jgi:hypothetical protein
MTVLLPAPAVSLIALLHSSFDFSLQIAGYSIVVFAILGVGLSQAAVVLGKSAEPSKRRRSSFPGVLKFSRKEADEKLLFGRDIALLSC